MWRRPRRRLYQPSNCSGAVPACHLFWPGLHQPVGNKKQDKYEDEEEVEEVEDERDDHEGDYEDERMKTMATIMTTMAIVFFRLHDRDIHPHLYGCTTVIFLNITGRRCISTNPAAERLYQR